MNVNQSSTFDSKWNAIPEANRAILSDLIDFVNRLPMSCQADRIKMLNKLIEEQFGDEPEEKKDESSDKS